MFRFQRCIAIERTHMIRDNTSAASRQNRQPGASMDRAEESEDGLGRHHRTASGQADSATPEPVDLAGYVLDEQFGFLLRQMQQRYVAMFLEMMGEDGPQPSTNTDRGSAAPWASSAVKRPSAAEFATRATGRSS